MEFKAKEGTYQRVNGSYILVRQLTLLVVRKIRFIAKNIKSSRVLVIITE
jgi:hypothetical protein